MLSISHNFCCEFFQNQFSYSNISTLRCTLVADEPVISVPATVVVNETGELHLHCAVDSSPPPLSIKWKKLDNTRESISANYTASPVTKSYAGNYTCIVMYRLEPSGESAIQSQKLAYTYVHVQC